MLALWYFWLGYKEYQALFFRQFGNEYQVALDTVLRNYYKLGGYVGIEPPEGWPKGKTESGNVKILDEKKDEKPKILEPPRNPEPSAAKESVKVPEPTKRISPAPPPSKPSATVEPPKVPTASPQTPSSKPEKSVTPEPKPTPVVVEQPSKPAEPKSPSPKPSPPATQPISRPSDPSPPTNVKPLNPPSPGGPVATKSVTPPPPSPQPSPQNPFKSSSPTSPSRPTPEFMKPKIPEPPRVPFDPTPSKNNGRTGSNQFLEAERQSGPKMKTPRIPTPEPELSDEEDEDEDDIASIEGEETDEE